MLQGTVDEIVNEEGAVRGPIWLGLYHGFPSSRLAEFIAHFLGSYPDTSIRLTHAPLSELTTRLLRGRLDFSLSFQPGSAENQRLYGTKLYDQELVLAAGRSFFRRGFDPDELRRVPVIDYYQSAPLISRWLEHHYGPGADGLQPKVWAATTDQALELVLKQVGAGGAPVLPCGPTRSQAPPQGRGDGASAALGLGLAQRAPRRLQEPGFDSVPRRCSRRVLATTGRAHAAKKEARARRLARIGELIHEP